LSIRAVVPVRLGLRRLLPSLLAFLATDACGAVERTHPLNEAATKGVVFLRSDHETCNASLLEPISGRRWRVGCDGVREGADSTCHQILAQSIATWHSPETVACGYAGTGEVLLHASGRLANRFRLPDSLGSVIHLVPCLELAITVGRDVPGNEIGSVVYRVIGIGDSSRVLATLGAGTVRRGSDGGRTVFQPARLLVDMPHQQELLVTTSRSRQLLAYSRNACDSDGTMRVPLQADTIHLQGLNARDSGASLSYVSRSAGRFEVGLLLGNRLSRNSCDVHECVWVGHRSIPEPVVAALRCGEAVCLVVRMPSDSLALRVISNPH
jgi:hypothetical protein